MSNDSSHGTGAADFSHPSDTMAPGTRHAGFVVERVQTVPEIGGVVYVLRHEATGARAQWLACADENKSFSIAFKTPPADDTGVFHILEHSVLCGSDRYPVKEPFVNLLKTSMQTFLNALTFSDKTMYPVASTNARDLENLTRVYLDAVFHPAIAHRPRIFEQEGWHYELDSADAPLTVNGVVYNEMRGALSDPDSVLYLGMNRALFPDTCYSHESGGHPDSIPDLTYEGFLDTHARHYAPDNAYVTLYGDLDADRFLGIVDGALSGAAKAPAAPNALLDQAPIVAAPSTIKMATSPDNAAVGLGYVFATSDQRERVLATDILLDALMGSNEAPLKRALLAAHLGDDVTADLADGIRQPYLLLQLKGAHPGVAQRFRDLVEETCARLAEDGLGHDNLESSLSQAEFNLREGDWGAPDGVELAVASLSGWLYDDDASCDYLRYEDALAHMREHLDDGYFEDLLRQIVCASTHSAMVELVPTATAADATATRLAKVKAGMDGHDLEAVMDEATALHEEQATPDSAEALATLPQLQVADIGPEAAEPVGVDVDAPLPCVAHELPTRHITYAYHYFDLGGVYWAELPYVSVLCSLLGQLGTRSHTATELDTLVEGNLGNLSFFTETYGSATDPSVAHPYLVVGASSLSEKVDRLASIPAEVWSSTLFEDKDRIFDILQQQRISLEQGFVSSGHSCALSRVGSYFSAPSLVSQQTAGVDYYLFLKRLLDHYDERFRGLSECLYNLASRIFTTSNVWSSITGPATDRERFWDCGGTLRLSDERHPSDRLVVPAAVVRQEAFVVPSDGCFAAEGIDGTRLDVSASGSWLVAGRALSFDYLWNEVRVLGGAYGCGFRCSNLSQLQFYSFRDPAVDPTVERFEKAAGWLASWDPTSDEFAGYVVSTVAGLDAPVRPRAMARRQDGLRLAGKPDTWRLDLRNQVLGCDADAVRALSRPLSHLGEGTRGICVFGGRDQVAASELDLDVVELMGSGEQDGTL